MFAACSATCTYTGKLVWGISGVDRGDDFNRWVPDDRGVAVFDSTFSFASAAAQDHYQATCDRLKTEACTENGCMDGTFKLTRPGEVYCFYEDWQAWHLEQACTICQDDPDAPWVHSGSSCSALLADSVVTCDTDLAAVHAVATHGLATIRDHCRLTCGECVPDAAAVAACRETTALPTGPEFVASLIAFRSDPMYFRQWGEQIGVVGNQLKYVAIDFVTTLQHGNPEVTTRTM